MMKIAFVNTEFLPVPPVRGGAVEEWIQRVSEQMPTSQVHVFSRYDEKLPARHSKEHIHYYHFRPSLLDQLLLSTYKLPFKNEKTRWFQWPYASWCARQLSQIQPDVIHIHNRPHFVSVLKKYNPKAKIVLHVHQMSVLKEESVWTEDLIRDVDLFLGCSQFIADQIKKMYPTAASKVNYVYNAINLHQFPDGKSEQSRREEFRRQKGLVEKTVLLYVGRLAENKGVRLLVDAIVNLVRNGQTQLHLIVCGARGYANREITPYIQGLYDSASKAEGHVTFTGHVSYEDITHYYLMADAVVIPSEVEEGFCLVTIESMAVGVPVIASNRGGVPEVLNKGTSGLLVNDVSVQGFEKAIEGYLAQKKDLAHKAAQGRKTVEDHFTWERVTLKLEQLYRGVVGHA